VASLRVIRKRRPDVVLGFGGFASFPGALMAVVAGRPLVVHDANAVAGLANRILAHAADRILQGFPGAFRGSPGKSAAWVGNPLRDDIVALDPPERRFAGREGPLRLLALNDAVPAALSRLPEASRPQVVHQSGERRLEALQRSYASAGIAAECVEFIDDMAGRYAWADIVVCRGGALTVAELAAVGLGAIVVPLPGAIADEQSANARFLLNAGAAIVIAQAELAGVAHPLAGVLGALTRAQALTMAVAAHGVGKRDAAERVASICIELADG
jgi:UDP-N-acetylglucosamine--N-acetylmuramyl-(pentapeptide) pyrophosphoryl-undecaprenol N-acetylglucosamine transferase